MEWSGVCKPTQTRVELSRVEVSTVHRYCAITRPRLHIPKYLLTYLFLFFLSFPFPFVILSAGVWMCEAKRVSPPPPPPPPPPPLSPLA